MKTSERFTKQFHGWNKRVEDGVETSVKIIGLTPGCRTDVAV